MAHFVVENFKAGLDLRRSPEVGSPGSLRELRNAFINEGGEIEKAKALVKDDALTAYGQTSVYKDFLTGPFEVPGYPRSVFFRHRHNSLPGSFTAGAGTEAAYYQTGAGIAQRTFWAMRSAVPPTNFGALFHGGSYAEFGAQGYVVESWLETTTQDFTHEHALVSFTGDEPTSESYVAANAGRPFQLVLGQKGYVIEGDILHASAINLLDDMAGTGSGLLNFSKNGRPIGDGLGLGEYFGQLVALGRKGVQLYTVDADFALNQYQRSLTAYPISGRTAVGFADGDLVYLDRSGVRSLRARDSSNLARIDDIGSPIDRLVQAALAYDANELDRVFSLAGPEIATANHVGVAPAVVHPNGQLWVFIKDKIYVLSRHTAAGVLAWSVLDMPSVTPANQSERNGLVKSRWCADVCRIGQTIVMRNFANEVFAYGGENNITYDSTLASVTLPFLDMNKPGRKKFFRGIDLVAEGDWIIEMTTDPHIEGVAPKWTYVGEISSGDVRARERHGFDAEGMHIGLRLRTQSQSAAKIAQIVVYYDEGAEK